MAETKLFRKNEFKIVGTLKNVDVKTGVGQKGGYVSVDALITSVIGGEDNEYQVSFYANETTQAGGHSKLYDTYTGLGSLVNKKVEVTGEIRENRYWSTNLGQLISTQLLSGKWIKGVVETTADEANYDLSGFILAGVTEKVNKAEEVYRYDVKIGQANFDGTMLNSFIVHINPNDREIVNGVQGYNVGDTVRLQGKLAFTVKTETVTDENSGFGAPITKTYTNKQRNFYVVAGSNPIDGEGSYDSVTINTLVTAYKNRDVELMNTSKKEVATAPVSNAAPVTKRQASLL